MTRLVRDVMTTEVVTVEPSTPFMEIVARFAWHQISGAPVVGADRRVLGVVSETDLLLEEEEHPEPKADAPLTWTKHYRRENVAAALAGRLMTAPAVTVPQTATVTEAARRKHTARIKRLPVVDATGRLAGIVSRAGLPKAHLPKDFTRSDEAIRSEIVVGIIVGDFMLDPSRFSIRVQDGVVVVHCGVERRSLIPFLIRAVHDVKGVVRVETRLTFDVHDHAAGMAMAYGGRGPDRPSDEAAGSDAAYGTS
jgi:CBS domain-containing protein